MSENFNRLKELRISKGVMAKDVADILDISYRNYQRYENGTYDMSATKIKLLAQYYNVTADYLLGTTNDPTGYGTESFSPSTLEFAKRFQQLDQSSKEHIMNLIGNPDDYGTTAFSPSTIAFAEKFQQLDDRSKEYVIQVIERELTR